jgi:putative oxidoreductase
VAVAASLEGKARIVSWICQIGAAVILGQTLFFKFSGAEESIYIFEQINAEPWGRIGTGLGELLTVVLLLIPRTAGVGGLLGMGLMFGAIGAHLTKLGVVVQGDGGLLFGMALTTFMACAVVAFLRRRELPLLGSRF